MCQPAPNCTFIHSWNIFYNISSFVFRRPSQTKWSVVNDKTQLLLHISCPTIWAWLHIGCLYWLPIFVFAYWLPGAVFKALLSQVEEKLSFEMLAYRGPLKNNAFTGGPLHPFKNSGISSKPPSVPLITLAPNHRDLFWFDFSRLGPSWASRLLRCICQFW